MSLLVQLERQLKGKVIAIESDGLYIDIGGKAPGFMPKKECGLGVITNFKEKFPNWS